MKKAVFYKLTEDFHVIGLEGLDTWDKGELFLYRKTEAKRHGAGQYPDRLISCTDGSMVGFKIVKNYEKKLGRKILEEVSIINLV